MRWLGGEQGRAGWVQAPSAVEQEIRTVWLEDEMPEELTSSPGYVPFTLGPEAQAWVDSMAEVVDGGKAVYGRPRPAAPPTHRQLATPPPDMAPRHPPPPAQVQHDMGRRLTADPGPTRPAPMPQIGGPEAAPDRLPSAPRTLPKRVLMPEIAEPQAPPSIPEIEKRPSPPAMPEIGE